MAALRFAAAPSEAANLARSEASSLSLADIWVAFCVGMISSGFLDGFDASLLTPYPKMLAIAKKVYSIPELKAYYTTRAAAKPMYKCFVV